MFKREVFILERKQAKFSVRMPDELNKFITEEAADMGMSKNGFILFLIQMWKKDKDDTQAIHESLMKNYLLEKNKEEKE